MLITLPLAILGLAAAVTLGIFIGTAITSTPAPTVKRDARGRFVSSKN